MSPATHPWPWLVLGLVALVALLAWQWWLHEAIDRQRRAEREALRARVDGLLAANHLGRQAFRARQQMHAEVGSWAGRVIDGETVDQ